MLCFCSIRSKQKTYKNPTLFSRCLLFFHYFTFFRPPYTMVRPLPVELQNSIKFLLLQNTPPFLLLENVIHLSHYLLSLATRRSFCPVQLYQLAEDHHLSVYQLNNTLQECFEMVDKMVPRLFKSI